MSDQLPKPKLIQIQSKPQVLKYLALYFLVPILVVAGWCLFTGISLFFGFLFFAFFCFWLCKLLFGYHLAKNFFASVTQDLKDQGERIDYNSFGVWLNTQDRIITLIDRQDRVLVQYDFSYITSIGRYDLLEKDVYHNFSVVSNPMMGTHINHHKFEHILKAEIQLIIGTRDPYRPEIILYYPTKFSANKAATDLRQILSASYYV